nr:hypothetical protein [Tanacetum cinerariifolium]
PQALRAVGAATTAAARRPARVPVLCLAGWGRGHGLGVRAAGRVGAGCGGG